jgi:hypothetical protein
MSAAVLAALAAGAALGLLLVVAGLTGRAVIAAAGEGPNTRLLKGPGLARVTACTAAFLVVVGVTGWIVGGVLAGVAVIALPRVLGGKSARQRAIDRTEAVASWTEMVRDSIVAASGL